jgi:hypothetical protein
MTHKGNMMKNISKYAIGLGAALVVGCASVPPPTERIAISKVAIDNAVSAGGPEFAPAEMNSARDKLARANVALSVNDYAGAKWLAEQAQADADLAASKSRTAQAQKAALAVQEDGRVLHEELDRKSK